MPCGLGPCSPSRLQIGPGGGWRTAPGYPWIQCHLHAQPNYAVLPPSPAAIASVLRCRRFLHAVSRPVGTPRCFVGSAFSAGGRLRRLCHAYGDGVLGERPLSDTVVADDRKGLAGSAMEFSRRIAERKGLFSGSSGWIKSLDRHCRKELARALDGCKRVFRFTKQCDVSCNYRTRVFS